jgi:predicted PurR-regulated permease PerM
MNEGSVGPAPEQRRAVPPDDGRRWVTRAIATLLLGALALVVAVWLILRLRSFLTLLAVAFFFSFAMEPAVTWLARRGVRRGAGTAAVMLGLAVFSVVMLVSVGRLLFEQTAELAEKAPDLIHSAVQESNDAFGTEINASRLSDAVANAELPIRDITASIANGALSVTTSVVGLLFNFLTMGLFAFYLTADGPRVRRTVCSYFPEDKQRVVLGVWEVAIEKTGGYLYSRLLLAGLSAFFAWLFLTLAGIPYAIALALWLGLTSQFVPTVGTYLGGALLVLIALINAPVKALLVVLYIVVYQQLENYLFSPRVTAHTMSLHPAVAFGSVIVGAALAGGIGALLALPAAAIAQALGSTYIRRHEVIEAEMLDVPQATAAAYKKHGIFERFKRTSA